ncbi:uncharacterized protein F5Z01DRAFT_678554 [Emericellopsis atlantica]|uniref:Uncharacterized protein n=1 Tax=Emericellopsis atlantica TaxID=2614577 RepID=A0A9P7ZCJ8_9HYPO|nr:uncharacterized protein F5Z01DRAFT_678554 [Emericellopsis atlantica]KAG9249594.1 hypothetical protein F5Z01DRAFT_678554 [Emericellopsis atlantica]
MKILWATVWFRGHLLHHLDLLTGTTIKEYSLVNVQSSRRIPHDQLGPFHAQGPVFAWPQLPSQAVLVCLATSSWLDPEELRLLVLPFVLCFLSEKNAGSNGSDSLVAGEDPQAMIAKALKVLAVANKDRLHHPSFIQPAAHHARWAHVGWCVNINLFLAANPSLGTDLSECSARVAVGSAYCTGPTYEWADANANTDKDTS